MKYKLSKRISIVLGISATLLYTTGMVLKNINESEFGTAGIACEIIALIYTAISSLLTTVLRSPEKVYVTPSFVDRTEAIQYCVSEIYSAIFVRGNGGVISIKCSSLNSIGKTELLKKLQQILTNKALARDYLPQATYLKYKRIYNKIGDVHLESYNNESDLSKIDDYPITLSRYDIVLLDNVPPVDIIPIKRKGLIIIMCRKADITSGECAVLTHIDQSDIIELCKKKCNQVIDDSFAERLLTYSSGNIKIISEVLNSASNIQMFELFSDSIYNIRYAIDQGDYAEASRLMNIADRELEYTSLPQENKIQLEILKADLLHYQNRYKEANDAFAAIAAKELNDKTTIDVFERQCHVQRHLGDFESALNICSRLPKTTQLQRALGLNYMAYSQYEDKKYYDAAAVILSIMSTELNKYISKQRDSYHTYLAVQEIYERNYAKAHQSIDTVIKLYESLKSKFLTNCYFIKAEIYRHSGNHTNACKYYQKCKDIYESNGDFDICTLVYVMMTYENTAHNVGYDYSFSISADDITKRAQELGMAYNNKLNTMLQKFCHPVSEHDKTEAAYFFEHFVFIIP